MSFKFKELQKGTTLHLSYLIISFLQFTAMDHSQIFGLNLSQIAEITFLGDVLFKK